MNKAQIDPQQRAHIEKAETAECLCGGGAAGHHALRVGAETSLSGRVPGETRSRCMPPAAARGEFA